MTQPSWWRRLSSHRRASSRHAAPVPTPLTTSRVGDILTHHGFAFRVDENGDLTGVWDGHTLWFMLRGDSHDIVQVKGRWEMAIPASARLSVLQAVNDWNRDQILPSAYIQAHDGVLALYADHAIVLQGGATEDQLTQVILRSLGTTLRLFSVLAGRLPAR